MSEWFPVAAAWLSFAIAAASAWSARRSKRRAQQFMEDYTNAVALIAVIAVGPELPVRAYKRVCRQYLDDRKMKAEVTVAEGYATTMPTAVDDTVVH